MLDRSSLEGHKMIIMMITDFTVDVDKIGLFGSGDVRFDNLDFEGHSIIFGSETLAILAGVDTTALNADDFDII